MNKEIRRLGIGLIVLFVALFLQLNYLQVVDAKRLQHDPRNTRTAVHDFSRPRGDIISADGTVLAKSVPTSDSLQHLRMYAPATAALFAHVTGFFSFTYGTEGVERTYNADLAGKTAKLKLNRLVDILRDRTRTANVTLSLPVSVQKTAADALGKRKGAVVALDPRTGAVLALWSFPSYDPNPLSAHDQKAVQNARSLLLVDPAKPLLPRAYRERYFPGSTFKVVTSAAALQNGITPDSPSYPTLRELKLPQTTRTLHNFGNEACGGPLRAALKVSCNTTFAKIGLDLGADKLSAAADAFGFGDVPPIDLPFGARSVFPPAVAFAHDLPGVAQSAIGQRDVAATPLEMALVAAGIANNGVIMQPYVMNEVRDSDGNIVRKAKPRPWRTAVPPAVAATLRDLMVGVVNGGTATAIAIPGVQVAAKTGTAQTGTGTSHAWIIGFAPADAPRIAVAVIVEAQPGASEATGGRVAAPIAKAVLQAALSLPGAS